jgi:phage portal protein BeeE
MALEEYASGSFPMAQFLRSLWSIPKTLSPKSIENIRGSFKGLYGGLENAHEVAVAEEGMQIKVLGTDPQKSQSIESRRFQIGEIAAFTAYRFIFWEISSVRLFQILSNNHSSS